MKFRFALLALSSPISLALAGQHARYVVSQWENFRSRDHSNDGGKMLEAIAKTMTDEEMKAMTDYILGLR